MSHTLFSIHQKLLNTPYGDDIYKLPPPDKGKFFIGNVAPRLSKFTGRLRATGLIKKAGLGTNGNSTMLNQWRTTQRFVDYCARYR